ncbi:hypothetical protein EON64_20690 [archaeon]|nr:MAG: hypothetical protein EON64_20690 [archaeon]
MIRDDEPVWKADEYTPFGKWMDGWETRRRRTEGHDWCIVQLGVPGRVLAIEVDTCFFTGNFSPMVSVQGLNLSSNPSLSSTVQSLIVLRRESVRDRGEHGRMGLAASDCELSTVAALQSEQWPMLVPRAKLGAGYEDTRRTIFHVSSKCA